MKKTFTLTAVLISIFYAQSFSQVGATNSGGHAGKVQPKIMVIPFTKEGEDIRTILEEDVNRRIAITKIKEAFDNRGFTTVDFTAKLKAAKENQLLTSDNQTDWKTQIIQMSGADIYVQAEVDVLKSSQYNSTCGGYPTTVTLILSGFEVSTGNSLSNKVGKSPSNCTIDIGYLAEKAVGTIADDFLNVMQSKFDDIVENGVEIVLDFTFDQNGTINMETEVGSDQLPLRDALDFWIEEAAFKNNWTDAGGTDYKKTYILRIPLKDQATGLNYNASKFSLSVVKFLKSLSLESKRLTTGNTINITIKS